MYVPVTVAAVTNSKKAPSAIWFSLVGPLRMYSGFFKIGPYSRKPMMDATAATMNKTPIKTAFLLWEFIFVSFWGY
jgi:hypothetical protein